MHPRLTIYQTREKAYAQQEQQAQQRYNRIALIRLLFFVGLLGGTVFIANSSGLGASLFALVVLVLFLYFMRWHQRIAKQKQLFGQYVKVNQQEQVLAERSFEGIDDGADLIDPAHPYAIDLDLFGSHSFFHHANRTRSSLGRQRFADMLCTHASLDEIKARQAALQELSENLEARQDFQARGVDLADTPEQMQRLLTWLNSPSFVAPFPYKIWALYAIPVYAFLCIASLFVGVPWGIVILLFIPIILFLRKHLERVNKAHAYTGQAGKILGLYAELLQSIEQQQLKSPKLQALQEEVKASSKALRKLAYISSQLDVRYNAFAILLNLVSAWDLQWIYRLELWKEAQREALPQWFDALAEYDALQSFATWAYNNPHCTYPTVQPEGENTHLLDAQGLGHPLLDPAQCVTNDLHLPTAGHIKLVTGSNMGGKTTFLRTVGLNVVLAMLGAPVYATHLELQILRVYTSMRTQDALHEATSSFYAELKRLKTIIDAVESQSNVLFLLDEILKGTNSRDQHEGAKALVQQLIRHQGVGLIATHDLQIGQLEQAYDGEVENVCFEVQVKGKSLYFDYKMKKGISNSFNATILMQRMGIEVSTDLS